VDSNGQQWFLSSSGNDLGLGMTSGTAGTCDNLMFAGYYVHHVLEYVQDIFEKS
jgi:hypothetical protein